LGWVFMVLHTTDKKVVGVFVRFRALHHPPQVQSFWSRQTSHALEQNVVINSIMPQEGLQCWGLPPAQGYIQ
jgi:hypothetical protein